jgi:hypothetical protein
MMQVNYHTFIDNVWTIISLQGIQVQSIEKAEQLAVLSLLILLIDRFLFSFWKF